MSENDRPEQAESELDRLLSEFESGKLGKRPLLSAGATWPIGCAIVMISAYAGCASLFVAPILAIPILVLGIAAAFWVNRLTASQFQKHAVARLASLDDIRIVPPMLEILHWPAPELRFTAAVALRRLLPRIAESDSNLLQPKHREIMREHLSNYLMYRRPDVDLAGVILTSLEKIGTATDVYVVAAVARKPAVSTAERAIKEQAERLLPILKARVHGPANLLRAAEPPGNDSLLRPAGGSDPSDPSSLLRPADEEKLEE